MKLKTDIETIIYDVKRSKFIATKNKDIEQFMYYQGIQEALEWVLLPKDDKCKDTSWSAPAELEQYYYKRNT